MRSTHVRFANARREILVGTIHGDPAANMVISCHGMFSHKEGSKHLALASALEKRGVACLRFDFAGCGESDGSLLNLSYSQRVEDLDAAINYLCSLGASRIGVFGSSMGGAVAYLTAARDERIVCIATLAAIAHPAELVRLRMPEAIEHLQSNPYYDIPQGRIGRGFWEDSLAHDVVAAVRILRARILVVHGDADEVVPCSDAHDIATAARHASLDLVAGADHAFTNAALLRPAIAQIASFLADSLESVEPELPVKPYSGRGWS